MAKKIGYTKHALQRIMDHDLTLNEVEVTILEGEKLVEGKTKTRYTRRTRRGVIVAICSEDPESVTVITVTLGGM